MSEINIEDKKIQLIDYDGNEIEISTNVDSVMGDHYLHFYDEKTGEEYAYTREQLKEFSEFINAWLKTTNYINVDI